MLRVALLILLVAMTAFGQQTMVPCERNIQWNTAMFELGKAYEALEDVLPFLKKHEMDLHVGVLDIQTMARLQVAIECSKRYVKALERVRKEMKEGR